MFYKLLELGAGGSGVVVAVAGTHTLHKVSISYKRTSVGSIGRWADY